MGKIKKILENELIGGTQGTDVYPITSTKAVYDENNGRLDNILRASNEKLTKLDVQKADIKLGANLFDKDSELNIPHSLLDNNGVPLVQEAYKAFTTSDFIKVEPSTHYSSMLDQFFAKVCFYNVDKTHIGTPVTNVINFTTPSACAFIRISVELGTYPNVVVARNIMEVYVPYSPIDGYLTQIKKDAYNIAKNAVTPYGEVNLIPNSFHRDADKLLMNNGIITSQIGYNTSDYIYVTEGVTYACSLQMKQFRKICFYDFEKISLGEDYCIQNSATFTAPKGAWYARVSYASTDDNYFMLCVSNTPLPFMQYNPIKGYLPNIEDKVDIKVGTNIIPPDAVFLENTFTYNNGELATGYSDYTTLDLFPIKGGKTYAASKEFGIFRKITFFDSTYISLGEDYCIQNSAVFTAPTNAAYVRISFTPASKIKVFMVAENDAPLPYVAYNPIGGYIKDVAQDNNQQDKTINAIKKMKMADWSELQFGMFIHWGVYSAWAGEYHGLDIDGKQVDITDGTEWMWHSYKIPKAAYKAKASSFNSTNWNPDYICKLAKSVGMKYIVLTLCHHEGFSLIPTSHRSWDITSSSADSDVVMRLKKACDRHHLKFCVYISALLDWNDKGGFGQEQWNGGVDPYTLAEHESFTSEQVAYCKEIVDIYDPYLIWYDGGTYITQPSSVRKIFNDGQLKNYPYMIVNERGSGGADWIESESTYADFPDSIEKHERCNHICGWGYNAISAEAASSFNNLNERLWDMAETFSRGFNYLLNICPNGSGGIPSGFEKWFDSLASFLRKYTFFNGAKRLFNYAQPSWGRTIYVGNSVYMLIKPNGDSNIYVDSILTKNLKGVYVYGIENPASQNNYEIISDDRLLVKNVPTTSDDYFPIVRLDFTNDVICYDYNIISSTISPLSFVRIKYEEWQSQNTELLFNGKYIIGSDAESISASRFKYTGITGSKTFTINGTPTGSLSIVFNLYNEMGKKIFTGTMSNLTIANVPLTNGSIYTMELVKSGAGYCEVTNISIS